MPEAEQKQLTILFADIVGSTPLYEQCGDVNARAIVASLIDSMSRAAVQHHGVIVKTIGDAVMARFDNSEQALLAAVAMQQDCDRLSRQLARVLAIKIGLHHGPILIENGDLFGDAVNTAARIVDLSCARKLYLTGEMIAQISPSSRNQCRLLDVVAVKGRQRQVKLYEYVWEQQFATQLTATVQTTQAYAIGESLLLSYDGVAFCMAPDRASLTVGRSEQCDIQINAPIASRVHLKFERRQGRIYVTDNSTNGTSVRTSSGITTVLRRESLPLEDDGHICVNARFSDDPKLCFQYQIIAR